MNDPLRTLPLAWFALSLLGCAPTYEEYDSVPADKIAQVFYEGRVESTEFFGVCFHPVTETADTIHIGIYPAPSFRATEGSSSPLALMHIKALFADTLTGPAGTVDLAQEAPRCRLVVDNATAHDVELSIDHESAAIVESNTNLHVILSEGLHVLSTKPCATEEPATIKEVLLTQYALKRQEVRRKEVHFYIYNVNASNSYEFRTAAYTR